MRRGPWATSVCNPFSSSPDPVVKVQRVETGWLGLANHSLNHSTAITPAYTRVLEGGRTCTSALSGVRAGACTVYTVTSAGCVASTQQAGHVLC